jgi:endonuclease I
MDRAEKQRRLSRFARSIAPVQGELESLGAGRGLEEWPGAARGAGERPGDEEAEAATRALVKLERDEPLDDPEMGALEAIVLPRGRPVIDVVDGGYPAPGAPWRHLDEAAHRAAIEPAIRSIGRIEIPEHPALPYAGTGFVVGDGLIMTNRHVAELFVLGLGLRELRFRPGLESVGVDFVREIRHPEPSTFFRVERVLMVHPYWDMALLRVAGLAEPQRPLELEPLHPDDLQAREVVVIGYPARDPRNDLALQDRIFRRTYRVKRLQPGKARGARRTRSFGHDVDALAHDSSTLGGNSGSAVLDARSGRVLGLHFGGAYLESNYAVPAFELSRDGRVVDAGVRFTRTNVGEPPPWDASWRSTAEPPATPDAGPAPLAVSPAPAADGVVSFTIPLRVTLRLGQPALASGTASVAVILGPTPAPGGAAIDVADARARAREKAGQPYYDLEKDRRDVGAYYQGLSRDRAPSFEALSRLLDATHRSRRAYAPARWVYPWVDRQPDGRLRSLYSASCRSFSFEEILEADVEVERVREERIAELPLEAIGAEALEAIEAALPFNCEHVVPQSWFGKREPMRGDLHHLFACEARCNSFRGNRAYLELGREAVQHDCGEARERDFEPGAGKGAVARATLYFLARYPGHVGGRAELPAERLAMLRRWHAAQPPGEWERHRNQAIFELQGNRNPFVDFPDWAQQVELERGFAREP